jgi:hypothetical protein
MMQHPDRDEHVTQCVECQTRLARAADGVNLSRVWQGVAAEVWAEQTGTVERLAVSLLRSPGLARALVTTPSLLLSWIFASVVVLGIGIVATAGSGEPWVALLAPALAGIGVAYAYGPGVDPAFELSQTMAVSDRMVLLVRVLAVFGVNALIGLVATLVASEVGGLTFGWLLPMTAVAALGLAGATVARSANTGVAVALAGWGLVVVGSAYGTRDLATAVESGALMPVYLAATAVLTIVALYETSGSRWDRTWR